MNVLKANGYKLSLYLNVEILNQLTDVERELIEYALDSYSFANKEKHGVIYNIPVDQWVYNIQNFYDVNHPKTKYVISVLSKFI